MNLKAKDFSSDQDVRWCPGCGDYAILKSIQKAMAELGHSNHELVFVSGIGCASRFPYYMKTYGFHTVHGRAPTIATGIKIARPDLTVWQITGDGDALSIGGNHLIHLLRRNPDIKLLLFNNKVYGLTKGQYSPTSETGMKTKTSPMGSIEQPIHPISTALSSGATFIARTIDKFPKHMAPVFLRASEHKGTSFIEILQNCPIFNDNIWDEVAAKDVKDDNMLYLEHGKPLIFGKEGDKGLIQNGFGFEVVKLGENGIDESSLVVHDEDSTNSAYVEALARLGGPDFPVAFGVLYQDKTKSTYEDLILEQIDTAKESQGAGTLEDLIQGKDSWTIK
ncbi:MAG: 2-oxoacid:ferredoxin oxidoreductase subunit beta [Lentisphaeria bacterium]|nr:2-oxoacid:ferredoxin oxidoreductase subunit beta [Lentisphaeria bacterium]NQZ67266.1 2-oxoacid:ferredoxin oxidoreductase subunit beta [Lentisphaeria bacterium]